MQHLKMALKRSHYGLVLCLFVALSSGCSQLQNLPFLNKEGASATSIPSGSGLTPQAIKTLMDSGNSKAKAGQWDAAIQDFQQVLNADAKNAQAHVQIGWAYAEQQKWDDAKQHLMSAVALDPKNAGAHANLAWVYAEKKMWNEAQTEAKRAIDLDPKNPYPHATLAWAYQSTGETGVAMAEYEKSLELNPKLDNSRLALGITYCNQGNAARANEQLKQLQKQGSPKATDLQTRLSKGCGAYKK